MPGLQFTFGIPPAEYAAALGVLDPRKVFAAARSAANDAGRAGKTAISRIVRQELNASKSAVDENIKVKLAKGSDPTAIVTVSRRPVPLLDYKARQTKKGVSVRVRKTQGLERHPSSFITAMGSGHRGVFKRFGPKVVPTKGRYAGRLIKRGPRKGKPILRQKIQERFGPTVVGVFANKPGILEAATAEIRDRYLERFRSKIGAQLQGVQLGQAA